MYLIFADLSIFTDTKFCKHSELPLTTGKNIQYDVMEVGVTSKRCQVAFVVDNKEYHGFKGYSQ